MSVDVTARLEEDARARNWDPVTELVMRTFRLNGVFLTVGEALARPHGLTAVRWQVLGAVLRTPMTVAGIAREMGIARQTVLPMANALVAAELAEFRANPGHRRAKLLAPTPAGREAISRIAPGQRRWAQALADSVGEEELRACVATLNRVITAAADLDPAAD
ncbi:MarR family winged helix-turn-helix transcriptional regulator [Spongisporangium articulatum]|uniref:MarR family winged helix-turn-helix transcriptional regulator n=1 Tax=Spongisporangium articulatum TaxID=3362603 RepID=A0ABW8AMZ5_9ACTN